MTKKEYKKALSSYPEALTASEVAEILRVCTKTVYKLIKQGEIPAVKIGRENRVSKSVLIRPNSLRKSNGWEAKDFFPLE